MEDMTDNVTQLKDTVESMNTGMIKTWLSSLIPGMLSFALCVILSFIVCIIGTRLLKLLRRMIQKTLDVRNTDLGVKQFIDQVVKIIGYVVLVIIILGLFGIETSSVAAAIASIGLTAGLALQGSLSNFAGGVLILILKPFVVGDYIVEHTHGNEGTVSEITIFYTKLTTIDNRTVVIPNGTLANSSLTNNTNNPTRILDLTVSISYEDDINRAKETLKNLAMTEEKRVPDTEILVFVRELSDSSIDLGLRYHVRTEHYWDIYWKTLERIHAAFLEQQITIPFQSINVYNR